VFLSRSGASPLPSTSLNLTLPSCRRCPRNPIRERLPDQQQMAQAPACYSPCSVRSTSTRNVDGLQRAAPISRPSRGATLVSAAALPSRPRRARSCHVTAFRGECVSSGSGLRCARGKAERHRSSAVRRSLRAFRERIATAPAGGGASRSRVWSTDFDWAWPSTWLLAAVPTI